jgi:thiopurine S-methyltransferase
MQAEFWHWIWERDLIGFHMETVNPFLAAHLGALGLAPGDTVFLPLCGKTRDIGWLLEQGFRVVGCDLSPLAAGQLFHDLGAEPQITEMGALACHAAPGLRFFVGDIFELNAEMLGPVQAVFDRAALYALPASERARYAAHLTALSGTAPQLLTSLIYDQTRMKGPPYAVPDAEVRSLYGATHDLIVLERVTEGGDLVFEDVVWLLRPWV